MTSRRPSVKQPARHYSRHGLWSLKRAVKELGGRVIDKRTTLGKALGQFRTNLVADLGGPTAITTQQATLVDLIVRTKLLLDSIDNWLLTQRSLVNSRKRALLPALVQRQALADSLARYMSLIGLTRRAQPVPSLEEFLTQRYEDPRPRQMSSHQDGGHNDLRIRGRRSRKRVARGSQGDDGGLQPRRGRGPGHADQTAGGDSPEIQGAGLKETRKKLGEAAETSAPGEER